jgi:hypothetical protein
MLVRVKDDRLRSELIRTPRWFMRTSQRATIKRLEYPFAPAQTIYEDTCHEGNDALPGILKGARKAEADSA